MRAGAEAHEVPVRNGGPPRVEWCPVARLRLLFGVHLREESGTPRTPSTPTTRRTLWLLQGAHAGH